MNTRIPILLLVILTFVGIGCGEKASTDQTQTPDPTSKFRWDFSKQRAFIYSYHQTIDSENQIGRETDIMKKHAVFNGKLNVKVREKNLADVSITDLEMKMYDKDNASQDTVVQKMPPQVYFDMKPDGSIEDPSANMLVKLLMPLPMQDLEIGEEDNVPIKLPFNANGSRLHTTGFHTLSFEGYEELDGKKCAVLTGKIDVSKLELPKELKGEYRSTTTGTGRFYFSIEHQYFVGADIKSSMNFLIDSEADNKDAMITLNRMDSDMIHKIRLISIDE